MGIKHEFNFEIRATAREYEDWLRVSYPQVAFYPDGAVYIMKFKNFMHSGEISLNEIGAGSLRVTGWYSAPRSLAWAEKLEVASLNRFKPLLEGAGPLRQERAKRGRDMRRQKAREESKAEAAALRAQGKTYANIAELLSVSEDTVKRLLGVRK